jgi:rod shape-determining protein MreD
VRRILLPALFTVIFIFESTFVEFMPTKFFNSERILVPHLLLITILFLTIYVKSSMGILYGFIFGLLFDIVYTEIIGIYLTLFPLTAYLISKLIKSLQTNFFIVTLVSLLGVAIVEIGSLGFNFAIHKTDMAFSVFMSFRLLPTLLYNLVITILVIYPLSKLFEKIAVQMRNE